MKRVQLLAVMPDGNFVNMQILKVEVTDDFVSVYVTYEAMADMTRKKPGNKLNRQTLQIAENNTGTYEDVSSADK